MTKPEPRRGALERDVHSHSNPHDVRVHHLDLDLDVRFAERRLSGSVTLSVDRVRPEAEILVLDTRDLAIQGVEHITGDDGTLEAAYELGATDPILGAPLRITLHPGTTRVRVSYETGPTATALQWLTPEQDGREAAAVHVHAVAGDSRPKLDPAAGQSRCTGHLFSDDPNAAGTSRRDERGERHRDANRR